MIDVPALVVLDRAQLSLAPSNGADLRQRLTRQGLDEAGRLGLLPLVAWLARRDDRWRDLDPDTRARLEASLMRGRADGLRWQAALDSVTTLLAAAGVPVLLFKGADLAFHVYPEPGLRGMMDLDLLVPEARLEDARRVLAEAGFREDTRAYSSAWYRTCLQRLPPLVSADETIDLDVHGRLCPRYSPFTEDADLVWRETLPSRWPGAGRLARPWAIWHLVLHAWMHPPQSGAGDRLRVDVLALLARREEEPMDWEALGGLCRRTRLGFAVAGALREASRVAGARGLERALEIVEAVAAEQRSRERLARWRHRVRQAAPFVGSGGPWPPDAWRQFVKRPWRVVRALGNRPGASAPSR